MEKGLFSIIIPTWNNLNFVKLCVRSIRENSSFSHQIILHINEGIDGTLQWAKDNKIDFTYSEKNIGICKSVNLAFQKCTNNYIVYMNDDMYLCPNWDKVLIEEIEKLPDNNFMLSATMIEPEDTGNPCVIVKDFGRSVESFNEQRLLKAYNMLEKQDWQGSMWPPMVVHKKYWEKIGGFSEEFSPGMYSDPDFAMKMWQEGCRLFKGVSGSRTYHFQSKSTGRIVKNNGKKQFFQKWSLPASVFAKRYLKRGEPFDGLLKEPKIHLKDILKTYWYKLTLR